MARCASRSFARLRSNCAAVSVETLRVPALEGRRFCPGWDDFDLLSELDERLLCDAVLDSVGNMDGAQVAEGSPLSAIMYEVEYGLLKG